VIYQYLKNIIYKIEIIQTIKKSQLHILKITILENRKEVLI